MAQANEQQETGIRCLVVPLTNVSVLLPSSLVAEVASYTEPAPVYGIGETPWLLGRANWRGLRIPLVSVEAFFENNFAGPGGRARVVVLKGLKGHPNLPFYGVLAQQIPRLANIAPDGIEPLQDEALANAPGEVVLAANEAAIMLDVDYVEKRVIDTLYS
jgi:chemotaxis signal transduction protein